MLVLFLKVVQRLEMPKIFAMYVTYVVLMQVIASFLEETVIVKRNSLAWKFCVAAVPYPIIGADILDHFDLL